MSTASACQLQSIDPTRTNNTHKCHLAILISLHPITMPPYISPEGTESGVISLASEWHGYGAIKNLVIL